MNRWDMELADTREAQGTTRTEWTCDQCRRELPQYADGTTRYCSDTCRRKAWGRGKAAWARRDRLLKKAALLAGHK